MSWENIKAKCKAFADAAMGNQAAILLFFALLLVFFGYHHKADQLDTLCTNVSELGEMDVPSALDSARTDEEKKRVIQRVIVSGTDVQRFALWKATGWNEVEDICNPQPDPDAEQENTGP